MSALPAPASRYAVNPVTGEMTDLVDAATDELAARVADTRDVEQALRDYKRQVSDEVVRRMDAEATWTVRLPGGLKLTAPSPSPTVEYDAEALRNALIEHAELDDVPSQAAIDKAVEPVVTYKVRQAGLNALRKLPGLGDLIDRHARPVEKARYVTVGRSS